MMLLPQTTAMFSKANMLSPDGRCKVLDASANGYVRSEAAAMALLRAGSAMEAVAIIVGTAINQDGRSSGLTAPNGLAQQSVLHAALSDAGMQPSTIAGLQLHGTGTALGDPIEVCADELATAITSAAVQLPRDQS